MNIEDKLPKAEDVLKEDDIKNAAHAYASKMSNAPDKETPDWIIADFKAGVAWALEQINKPTEKKYINVALMSSNV